MLDPDVKDWISVAKDLVVATAAVVTMVLGIYGVRTWKRDLVGKEVYSAARALVKESHLASKAARKLRTPIRDDERKEFSEDEIKNLTGREKWRISEASAYEMRKVEFSRQLDQYDQAKLDLRVLTGSRVYEGFLPFDRNLTECICRVSSYIDLLQDHSAELYEESPGILAAQSSLYPSDNLDDEFSQNLADSRESGELALLRYLHRSSIYG
ncbi:hypothetical protein K5D69_24140 [Pseudomonas cichorii]|uniref:hypothetical protein n=1 Tax=Pseudomonas cichorii TaxID=36746 RepID=UPI001C89F9A3|nr:hypothetical protein [Pseudomonas cichorii]MBX8517773.1 hypothetical protein [Pseudomonas cichorii]